MHLAQTASLRQATNDFSQKYGEEISLAVESKSALLAHWLAYLNSYHRTGTADSLLDAVESSIKEVAGALSLGLVRNALFSLRGQIDLLLAWIFFKDHSIEWTHVNQTADGFKLKKELLQYLDQYFPRFTYRLSALKEISARKEADPYRLLSAHIHAQSDTVLPVVGDLKDLVRAENTCKECTDIVFEVSEYLNDVLCAIYLPNWASLPKDVQASLNSRFKSPEQRKAFFS